jgi:peptidyl-prolyl cis-trans isomerase C
MGKFVFKIAGLVGIIILLTGSLRAQENQVLAKFGDKVITVKEFNRIINFYDPEQRKMLEKNPQLKETVLWQLIQGAVISKIARDKGFDKKPEIREQQALISNNFLATQYIQKELLGKITLTDKEASTYYKEHADEFRTPETVQARHILIKVDKSATEEDKQKQKAKAEEILGKIKGGGDFAKLAEEFSDDPGSKTKGGDLGSFAKGTMVPAFEEAAFSLKPGEVSGLVETDFGYHIIKTEDKKEAVLEPYENIKDKVKAQALEEKRKAKVTDFVQKALKDAKVVVNPEALRKP